MMRVWLIQARCTVLHHGVAVLLIQFLLQSITLPVAQALSTTIQSNPTKVVILGGTGRIGTAVATHLLQRAPNYHIELVGRRPSGQAAIDEILADCPNSRISYRQVESVWQKSSDLMDVINDADCVIHTAGPYLDEKPIPLELAIASERCRAYVDISDPLPFLETSLLMDSKAKASNTVALVAAGAFPGMSNVLAAEAASHAVSKGPGKIQDIRFQYFTAGLGGSGVVNLYITNLGFGEPMVGYDQGQLRFFMELSGRLLGRVDFFLPFLKNHEGNNQVQERVGTKTVFAWPFPEAATTAKQLNAKGNSVAAMGTAPNIWNDMLGILVSIVPRSWWRNPRFSQWMADFSKPMVLATDAWMKWTGMGETHAMRIDVTKKFGRDDAGGVSIVQAHDSFRVCVGQSCAEFALDLLLEAPNHGDEETRTGVMLPEQRYANDKDRARILKRLTTTPGTFCYTGPVEVDVSPDPPTKYNQALDKANQEEEAKMSG